MVYHSKASSYRVSLESDETSHIGHQVDTVSVHLNQVISDIFFLSEQHAFKEILRLTQDYYADDLANDLLAFSRNRGIYDQIRFIDETGMEIVRINNKGNPTIVPDKELQFKGTRYYFKETLNLGAGEVFVSRFDLNIEKGEIERPFKPMIRFGTPVFDSQGQKRGILLINYLAGTMFDKRSKESHFNTLGNSMLINSDGYWLHSPRDEDEWGFMLEERKDKRFDISFPDASQRIHEADSGQFYKDGVLFTFATLYPLVESQNAKTSAANLPDPGLATTEYEGYYWKFISIVPPDIIKTNSAPSFSKFIKLYLFLAGLLAIAVRFFVKEHLSRRQSEEKFRLIFESSNDAMMLLDENGFLDCNDATLKMFGCKSREEFCSKHPVDLSPARQPDGEESRQAADERIATAFSEGRHYFEWTHRRANGEDFPAEVLLTPVILEGKKILQGNVRDISERKSLEEALRKSHDELELRVDERTTELQKSHRELEVIVDELRASEEKFSKIFSSSPDSISVTSLEEGILVDVNEGFEKLFGYQRNEIIGKTTIEIDIWLDPEDRNKIVDVLKAEGFVRDYEVAMKNKLGEVRTVLLSIEIMDIDGRPHSAAIGHDITERKQAEELLSKSKAEFEAIFNANDDAVVFADTSRQIRLINPAFTAIFGYTLDDVKGKTTEILYADKSDYRDQGKKRYQVGKDAKQHLYEMRYRRKDSTEFISETLGTEVKNSQGYTIGFIGIMRDITERKLAEQELKESQSRYSEAQHLAHLGHWDLDIIKNELAWSDEVYQIFEIDPKRFGASYEAFVETIHPDDRDFVNKAYTDSVKSRVPYDIVHRLLMKDGRVKHVNERCETFYGDDGKPTRSVGTVQDITEKVLMEEKAKVTQAKLIQSNKMTSMGMLASSITHEINNPNNYIQHNASLLSKVWSDVMNILAEYYDENGEFSAGGFTYQELQKRIPQFVDGILDGSMRIKDIIGGIKGFAKNDTARWDVKFSVNDAIEDALSLLGNQIVKFTSNFHIDTAKEIPLVRGSRQQIEQVIINLIMNALQALPGRESAVLVSTSFDEGDRCVTIEVRDDGSGIEEDVLKNMMEPFYSTRLDSGGTGLGLFISKSIIDEHKGTLEFETEIGRGTTATIRLPLSQKEEGK